MLDSLRTLSPDFSDLATVDDRRIDLAMAALRIAAIEYKQLDAQHWLDELDNHAARARSLATSAASEDVLDAVDRALFEEAGFRGNEDSYYDPRNSFLNDVLSRRTGIPISLSVVYLEVASRAGVSVFPIGFPGHFLVGFNGDSGRVVIDPYRQGARLDSADLEALLEQVGGAGSRVTAAHLRPVTRLQVIMRMLNNLKLIYTQRADFGRAIQITGRILELAPHELVELRDRGLLRLQLGDARGAVRDLEDYASSAADGPELAPVRDAIAAARRMLAELN